MAASLELSIKSPLHSFLWGALMAAGFLFLSGSLERDCYVGARL
jgi:hypothetical protein